MLEMYHDKASWEANTNTMGEMSATDVGVGWTTVASADTTNYQTTVRAALGTTPHRTSTRGGPATGWKTS